MDISTILPILRVRIGLPADDTTKDAELTEAWSTSLALAETYCDRKFSFVAGAEEIFTYEADKTVSLERYPLEAVTSVNGVAAGAMPAPVRFERKTGLVFCYGYAQDEELTIIYDGGYRVYPPDLMQALLFTFDSVWKDKNSSGSTAAPSGSIVAMSVPDVGRVEFESFASASAGQASPWGMVPSSATNILSLYRREFV